MENSLIKAVSSANTSDKRTVRVNSGDRSFTGTVTQLQWDRDHWIWYVNGHWYCQSEIEPINDFPPADLIRGKETAVEWLIKEMFNKSDVPVTKDTNPALFELIQQAKEMEKRQIINARHDGRQDLRENGSMYKNDDQYYNEKFK